MRHVADVVTSYRVTNLQPSDFPELMRLEDEVFAAEGEAVLGPYYVRLCCDFFAGTCFLVRATDEQGEER